MSFTDYLLDISLIALVILQVRARRLTIRSLLIPIGLVSWAASHYLHGIPTAGNDLVLVLVAALAGTTLGALAGLLTDVRRGPDGNAIAKAGVAAAALWVLGTGTRFAFQLYASHGGAASIAHFSASHAITSGETWVAALILMAMGEVLARTAVVAIRAGILVGRAPATLPSMMDRSDSAN